MGSRSLCLSLEGAKRAKESIALKGLTQQVLAEKADLSRASVAKFFGRKPVDRRVFFEICRSLNLNWEELVIDVLDNENELDSNSNIDALVQKARERVKQNIYIRCGLMRVLDMTQPIELIGKQGIYTNVNILEKISGRRRLEFTELLQKCDAEKFNRFGLADITQTRISDLDAANRYSKLMVLGKPGAGKTTFLKSLAIRCSNGQFQPDHVPVFITLRDLAQVSNKLELIEVISNQYGDELKTIIKHGKALILLDGLDEVPKEDTANVLNSIRQLTIHFPDNRFIITCRIAAVEYLFEQFIEVEVADFNNEQISTFVSNWFKQDNSVKARRFAQKLNENKSIKELATNPLLLTLLCLVFEESGDFPLNRSELYKEEVDILLKKWDSQRNIERDDLYKKLSLKRKEDLLSYIAWQTFERGDYFFKGRDVEQYIAEYLCNLADTEIDVNNLELDSRAVLKSMEAQHSLLVERAHDIYSFSHLAFHEYFTARRIITNFTFHKSKNENLKALASHVSEIGWQEVFILAVSMLSSADDFLLFIKQAVDKILALDDVLQEFLMEIVEKAASIHLEIEPALVRAYLFARSLDLPFDLLKSLANNKKLPDPIAVATKVDIPEVFYFSGHGSWTENLLTSSMPLDAEHIVDTNSLWDTSVETKFVLLSACDTGLFESSNHERKQLLQDFQNKTKDLSKEKKIPDEWWKIEGQNLVKKLKSVNSNLYSTKYRQFNNSQKTLLLQYYNANKLLVNCLNSDCYVSRAVRQEIKDTLLLPIEGMKRRTVHDSVKQ